MAAKFVLILLLSSWLIFPGCSVSTRPRSASGIQPAGIITGKIMIKGGGPLAGGSVWFYDSLTGSPPFKNRIRRPPTLRIEIKADGTFRAELVPGKYYLRAVKRMSIQKAGLQDGDYVYNAVDNKGEAKEYVIKSGEILDIGIISDIVPYKKTEDVITTAVEGVIRDGQGNPVEGVTVFAFRDQTVKGTPLYFSNKTGSDGKYILGVPEGTYYLRARNKLKGGVPDAGQLLGTFGGRTPAPVSVKDGEIIKAVDITVTTVPGRGSQSRTAPVPILQGQ